MALWGTTKVLQTQGRVRNDKIKINHLKTKCYYIRTLCEFLRMRALISITAELNKFNLDSFVAVYDVRWACSFSGHVRRVVHVQAYIHMASDQKFQYFLVDCTKHTSINLIKFIHVVYPHLHQGNAHRFSCKWVSNYSSVKICCCF